MMYISLHLYKCLKLFSPTFHSLQMLLLLEELYYIRSAVLFNVRYLLRADKYRLANVSIYKKFSKYDLILPITVIQGFPF